MVKELIKVTNENGRQLVSARELYEGLGLVRNVRTRWEKKNIIENEYFKENVDWTSVQHDVAGNKTIEYVISLDFAKHLAMIARTPKSHEYRQYFIECEKQLKQVDSVANLLLDIYNGGQAGIIASKELTKIEVAKATKPLIETIEIQAPKVQKYEQFMDSEGLLNWDNLSDILQIGKNKMLEYLRNMSILKTSTYYDRNGKKKNGSNHNTPYATHEKYFETKVTGKRLPNGELAIKVFVKPDAVEYLESKINNYIEKQKRFIA